MAELDLLWMRRKIALVSQEPVLFATTIAANIAYGCEATQEEVNQSKKDFQSGICFLILLCKSVNDQRNS